MNLALSEQTIWNIGLTKEELLELLPQLTITYGFSSNSKEKSKVAPYIGTIKDSNFRIKENPTLTSLHSTSGSHNHTLIEGSVREFNGLTQVQVTASQINFRTLAFIAAPLFIAFGVISSFVSENIYVLSLIPIVVIFDILVLNGINSEMKEALSKFRKKIELSERKSP